MSTAAEKADRFLALHAGATPLLLGNPWDAGSAKLLVALGFEALGTTSFGFAATLGQLDGSASREQILTNVAAIVQAVDVPVSADLENCYADDPDGVAQTARLARELGLAGFSIEDFSRGRDDPFYEQSLAAERVVAAVEAAHQGALHLVVTARAENYIEGRPDLADTISRLQRYQEAGADVLFAPGVTDAGDIRAILAEVDLPVNVMLFPGVPTVAELADLGVRRISVGPAFMLAAFGAVVEAATELREQGTYAWTEGALRGMAVALPAFG